MSKHRIVGVVNLLLGFVLTSQASIILIFVMPKLNSVYSDFGSNNLSVGGYFPMFGLLVLGLLNLLFGLALLSKIKIDKEKISTAGLILAVVSLVMTFVLVPLSSVFSLGPLFSLVK